MKSITVGISTLQERVEYLENFFENSYEVLKEADEIIIVVQNSHPVKSDRFNNLIEKYNLDRRTKLIRDTKKGLARSRNLLIDHVTSDYLWIMDDDTQLEVDGFYKLRQNLSEYNEDIISGRTKYLNRDTLFKKYPSSGKLGKLQLLKLNSIELVCSVSFLKKSGIKFNEKIGYGTKYPAGAETIFLLNAYAAGASVRHLNLVIVSHPYEDKNFEIKWNKPGALYSKGVIARRTGAFTGILLIIRWILRTINTKASTRLALRYITLGYFKNAYK